MKKFILPFLLLFTIATQAQFNNSWIDYSKTYYKFKVTKSGLYRISQPTLAAAGFGTTNADHYLLWRNGKQVRLYTSTTGSPLGATDFIEFYGEPNDGKVDTKLYNNPASQLSDKYSLYSDTATYFLTSNSSTANLRYSTQTGTVVAPSTKDLFFMRDVNLYFRDRLNSGKAEFYGELVYSSVYDDGEGWTSNDITPATNFTQTLNNLNVYTAGPTNSLTVRANVAGNANNFRNFRISFNGDSIDGGSYIRYAANKFNKSGLSLSRFTNPNSATISVAAVYPGLPAEDRIVVGELGLTFPATFNFNNQKEFAFSLPTSTVGNHLVIDNFNTGGLAPTLLDLSTGLRIIGDITSVPGKIKFLLAASNQARNYVLISNEASNINNVTSLQSKTFLNITNPANQGDYVILSNPVLYNDGTGANQVDSYKKYRESINGGNHIVKVYEVDELYDQFGFGIPRHPAAIRDFILNGVDNWSVKMKDLFIIGRSVTYNSYFLFGTEPAYKALDLVPTFGWPASDVMMASRAGTVAPVVGVGRLSAISGNDVRVYLEKVIEYEAVQRATSCDINDKSWMKNIMHVVGGRNVFENETFTFYMSSFGNIAKLPMFGASVETFTKSSSAAVEQANSARIPQLLQEGVSLISYYGHSSASTFEFNLSNPADYNNQGKYPIFYANGCNAGDFFRYDPARINGDLTLSEKYILAPRRGSVGFLASTHYGIPQGINPYATAFYSNFSNAGFGLGVGDIIKNILPTIGGLNPNLDFVSRFHLEQNTFHGDPVLKMNNFVKPDYAIEEPLVKLSPNLITVADNSFDISIKYKNIGKAINDSIRVLVQRQLPDNSIITIYNQRRLAAFNEDSLTITQTINPLLDKGSNNVIVTLDSGNGIDELCETNNTVTKNFFIFEDELRPVYPYNYQIVNTSSIKYAASTANPLAGLKEFNMELDTTELFNSSFKKTYSISGTGGLVEFLPTNITYTDSTVYYWRVSIKPSNSSAPIWNNSSFIYLPNSTAGFGQSHYFQNIKSKLDTLQYTADRKLTYDKYLSNFRLSNGLFPPFININSQIINGVNILANWGTNFNTLQLVALDGVTGAARVNVPLSPTVGGYGSTYPTPNRPRQFEFGFQTTADRKKIMDFIDSMPSNAIIVMYPLMLSASNSLAYVDAWKADTLILGSGKSLYHKLLSLGVTNIDSFNRTRPFMIMASKESAFPATQVFGEKSENIIIERNIPLGNTNGLITSPYFGPAKTWEMFHWNGTSDENPSADKQSFDIFGSATGFQGSDVLLATVSAAKDTSISFINAELYPFLKVRTTLTDEARGTPLQLKHVRLNGGIVPEGAIAPNLIFTARDTVFAGEDYEFKLAFKNVSPIAFDSLIKTKFIITDRNNVPHSLDIPARKALLSGDTLIVTYKFNTLEYPGNNTLFIEFNPDNHQREQYHFNNILYKEFFAVADVFDPTLDVTFDAVHILNRDIVSAKPNILVKLKDENRFVALKDTALLKVQVKYPDGTLKTFRFDNDTMRFIPAVIGSGENTASIELKPYFTEDGEYELLISGKDVSGNTAGAIDYRVVFTVINKAMISNLLNYPNPFTSSTAFVFTLTGNEIPQNMRIQILTVTGKIVREITQNELGDIHVGRNITDYKWDGTDMYGQKLANGVYLYRVITNLNGKSLDQYKAKNDNTDKFFNNGYGKMYLMR